MQVILSGSWWRSNYFTSFLLQASLEYTTTTKTSVCKLFKIVVKVLPWDGDYANDREIEIRRWVIVTHDSIEFNEEECQRLSLSHWLPLVSIFILYCKSVNCFRIPRRRCCPFDWICTDDVLVLQDDRLSPRGKLPLSETTEYRLSLCFSFWLTGSGWGRHPLKHWISSFKRLSSIFLERYFLCSCPTTARMIHAFSSLVSSRSWF
jgi:hypothetical protein